MERDFHYISDKYTEEGAREIFERICLRLLEAKFPNEEVHRIEVKQGDGGVDVLVGDFNTPADIYQCKFFINGIGESQKQQIRDSFATSIESEKYKMKTWHLCLPCDLDISAFAWWSAWKQRKQTAYGIKIELHDGGSLIGQLKKYDLYNEYFDEELRLMLNEIYKASVAKRARFLEEIIAMPTEDELADYDGMLFVKKLECAKVRDIEGCKSDFFNAELSLHSINSKGLDEESRAYQNLKHKIHTFWRTQYRMYQSDEDGNELLTRTYERIEDADTQTLESIATINLMAKKGMLHQLAEDCSVGWLKDYKEKLVAYLNETGEIKDA